MQWRNEIEHHVFDRECIRRYLATAFGTSVSSRTTCQRPDADTYLQPECPVCHLPLTIDLKAEADTSLNIGRYMGVWLGGVDSISTFAFIVYAPIPLYTLLAIQPDHPLHTCVVMESVDQHMDGDEHYRLDWFAYKLPDLQLRYTTQTKRHRLNTGSFYLNAERTVCAVSVPPSPESSHPSRRSSWNR
jgi:hypothetical protein